MSHLSVRGEQSTATEGTSLANLTALANSAVGEFIRKTGPTTYQNAIPTGGGGTSGTVTLVSVVTANGVSGSVATDTTTPAITLTLGNITPGSITPSLAVVEKSVTLVDGGTISLDASLGNIFTVTATGDRTLSAPTNPSTNQKIIIKHIASGGARTLTLSTAAGAFSYGSDILALNQTASGKCDYIAAIYNPITSKWDVVGYVQGYNG